MFVLKYQLRPLFAHPLARPSQKRIKKTANQMSRRRPPELSEVLRLPRRFALSLYSLDYDDLIKYKYAARKEKPA